MAVVLTPFVGRLRGVDMRWLVTGAFVAFAASYFMRSHYTADASLWALALPLLLQGVAMSVFFVPLNTILLDGLPASCVPSASGISNFARITAGSFAASLITTYWIGVKRCIRRGWQRRRLLSHRAISKQAMRFNRGGSARHRQQVRSCIRSEIKHICSHRSSSSGSVAGCRFSLSALSG